MKLLLVDDESRLAEALSHTLKKNGYGVDCAVEGDTGLEMALSGLYDIIVLDWMMPGRNGITILEEIRAQRIQTPVLLLTARDAPKDRVTGLDAGADDYLVKPFSTEELLARLRALTRRKDREIQDNRVVASGFALNPVSGEVTLPTGKKTQLTRKEALLLEVLLRNLGCVLTKEQIMVKVWGYSSELALANVDLYIFYLRKKLETSCIKTIRSVGYTWQENSNVS